MSSRKIEQLYSSKGPAYITAENRDQLNPFVLFDAGPLESKEVFGPSWHPHSGVATLTFPYISDLHHSDSDDNTGIVKEGGFQWMQAGGGLWHQEKYHPNQGKIGIQQLWVRLGPEEESTAPDYTDVQPEDVVKHGNTRIFIGEYQGVISPVKVPADISYFDITLKRGESWSYKAPASQTRGFVYPRKGSIKVGTILVPELILGKFVDGSKNIEITAETDTELTVALAAPSPHKIVHEYGQMHTNQGALNKGKVRTNEIYSELVKKGILK